MAEGVVAPDGCALDGADGHTLYLCTAPDFLEHNRKPTREASVLAARVDTPAAR